MQNQRIRIRLKAFDHRLIDQATAKSSRLLSALVRRSVVRSAADTQRALHCSDLPAHQQRRAISTKSYSLASGLTSLGQPRNR